MRVKIAHSTSIRVLLASDKRAKQRVRYECYVNFIYLQIESGAVKARVYYMKN